ncbi:hypothetical protein CIPAW_01G269300 [Carya illinoinensis]|uniref:Uncharacterized protein n=1 Tax=Carya illinoinensis TaxID=32201 RepID=A0A8T1RUN6_CARIL|nr:hypothetical protein CIPAW_01G269300 [Carya illinoinensis]
MGRGGMGWWGWGLPGEAGFLGEDGTRGDGVVGGCDSGCGGGGGGGVRRWEQELGLRLGLWMGWWGETKGTGAGVRASTRGLFGVGGMRLGLLGGFWCARVGASTPGGGGGGKRKRGAGVGTPGIYLGKRKGDATRVGEGEEREDDFEN